MKPRPPTMRDKRRYVLAKIEPPWEEVDPKELYHAIHEAFTSLFGDTRASEAMVAVVDCRDGHAIARCTRGCEVLLQIAMLTVHTVDGRRVALRTRATSGTMLALKRRIIDYPRSCTVQARTLEIDGDFYDAHQYQGQKVDVIAKGFKKQELLFLTEKELEMKNHAATGIPDGI
ncbi:MAG: Rpp14/Pop5 family protein [Methanoregulaceae archaeon]|nr:Rpp14/Pop5 family protein [Methanoregulaceae archaeon]